jgi:predicted dehydrogenase
MEQIGIGIVGAGFIAETRARCYSKVSGGRHRIVAVADTDSERLESYASRYGVPRTTNDYRELLALPEVDMVDLCVPNFLHRPMTEASAEAGKHIVCTKPMTAYAGQDLPKEERFEQTGQQNRLKMLEVATENAEAMVQAANKAGVLLMYGENWVYAPSITKVVELAAKAGGTILDMRGGECHCGSHTPFSKIWYYAGGGALIRLGAHPIGAMIYLKRKEGLARSGKAIRPVSVVAEVGDLSRIPSVQCEEKDWIVKGWKDVENWGSAIVTFEDGAKGIVWASDTLLGGMESRLDVFLSNCHFKCNMSPSELVQAYAPAAEVFGDGYIIEKGGTKAGWSTPMPDEDWTSGHQLMCQAFVDSAVKGKSAESDGTLGMEVVRVIYSAYLSAAEGKRVDLA